MLRKAVWRSCVIVGSLAIVLGAANRVDADAIYHVTLSGNGFSVVDSGPAPTPQSQSVAVTTSNGDLTLRGAATSGPTGLGASAFTSSSSTNSGGGIVATSSIILDDILISSLSDVKFVSGSINWHLSGVLNIAPPSASGSAGAYIQTSGTVGGAIDLSGLINPCVSLPTQDTGCRGFPQYYTSGLLSSASGFTIDQVFTSASATLPVNVAIPLLISLTAGTGAGGLSASGSSDFLNTLTFATDRPVFNLPDGFTVNSVSGGIVNNRFVLGPGGEAPPQPVPEPATLVLMGTGMLGAGLARWRKRRG